MSEAWISAFPPGLILLLGGLLVAPLRGRIRQVVMLALPVLGLVHLWLVPDGTWLRVDFFSTHLTLLRMDALARAFGVVFHIAALLCVIYALHVRDSMQCVTSLVYAGSAIAALFAGDLLTLFVWWELTAISSVFLIWARRTRAARRSGARYLIVQVASGLLLLCGAAIHHAATGSLAFDLLGLETPGGLLIFLAFGIKAAFPLLHNWLQDAYPNATVTGTVWLSGFTTKLAIYALARGYAGTDILVPIGATMTAFPIFYAVIENDLRRVLSYSLNNQLGFMVVGIGIGSQLSLDGTVAHVFAHVIYKALLFMTMGAVLLRTGTVKGSELGGLYKSMPWTAAFCIVGAASISAFPLTSGFVSKSLILSAAAHEHRTLAYLVLLFASAGVFHHSGIKIPFFAFFGHDRGHRVEEAPWNMRIAMGASAALCLGIGIFPGLLYHLLPFKVAYVPYSTTHVFSTLQLLLFSALAFTFLMKTGIYPPELRSTVLDFDWVYRRALPTAGIALARRYRVVRDVCLGGAERVHARLLAVVEEQHRPWSRLGEPWLAGTTAMWAAVLLLAYLLLNYS